MKKTGAEWDSMRLQVISSSSFPSYFKPCATSEWEVLLNRDGLAEAAEEEELNLSKNDKNQSISKSSELSAKLKLPEAMAASQCLRKLEVRRC